MPLTTFRLAVTFTLACAAWATAPSFAEACSCIERTPAEQFASATAVFEGRVVSNEGGIAELDVVQAWKGITEERVRVQGVAPTCDHAFPVGSTYLVYAQGDGILTSSICTGTLAIEHAEDRIRGLGAGVTPVAIQPSSTTSQANPRRVPPTHVGCASCRVLSRARHSHSRTATGLGLLLFGMLVARRQRVIATAS